MLHRMQYSIAFWKCPECRCLASKVLVWSLTVVSYNPINNSWTMEVIQVWWLHWRNRIPPSHIWNIKNRYPLTRKSDVLTKTLHQNSSISLEEWFHVWRKYKQMFSMTISIDSSLMVAVLSTKTYTNHPHETLLYRGPYTFTLDLFGWRLRPPTIIRRDGCSGPQYTLLHSHRLLVIGWQWGW